MEESNYQSEIGGNSSEQKLLRFEIIESQKSQADFLKWKLISIAAIGSISLSSYYSENINSDLVYLLCLIPIVCAYVDLISIHLMLRIIVIGSYLRQINEKSKNNLPSYERFVSKIRESNSNPFLYEIFALHGSSLLFGILLIIFGLIHQNILDTKDLSLANVFILFGIGGMFFTLFLFYSFTHRVQKISKIDFNKDFEE